MLKPLSELDVDLARQIELVGFDVDGVLTDGGVYIGGLQRPTSNVQPPTLESQLQRVELKCFDVQDRVGIKLLRDAGVKVVWVSGRHSEATTLCAEEIGIDELYQDDGARKLPAFQLILERYGIRIENTAFMGDDLPDIPLLMRVGLPVTVPNATRDVAEVAEYVTETAGGQGAVREFCETLLRVRGAWHTAVTRYLAARDDVILESTNAFSIS